MIPGNYKERLVGTETFKCSRTIQVLRILFVLLNFYETCINHELSGTMKPIVGVDFFIQCVFQVQGAQLLLSRLEPARALGALSGPAVRVKLRDQREMPQAEYMHVRRGKD